MKRNLILLGIILSLLSSCAPKVYNIGVWFNKDKVKKPYQKVYILAMLDNTVSNYTIETDFQNYATSRGLKTIKNGDIFPTFFNNRETAKEIIIGKTKELGCDAIFTVGLKDIKNESRYVPGQNTYQPYSTYGYYNQFPGYYNNYYNTTATPGYYVNDEVYFIECNLFDVETHELIFSIQSKTYNPTDIKSISKAYCKEIAKTLRKEGIVKSEK